MEDPAPNDTAPYLHVNTAMPRPLVEFMVWDRREEEYRVGRVHTERGWTEMDAWRWAVEEGNKTGMEIR